MLKTERNGVFGLSALVAVALFVSAQAVGRQIDVAGPPGSVGFGESVTALPSGNFVVIDAYADSATFKKDLDAEEKIYTEILTDLGMAKGLKK